MYLCIVLLYIYEIVEHDPEKKKENFNYFNSDNTTYYYCIEYLCVYVLLHLKFSLTVWSRDFFFILFWGFGGLLEVYYSWNLYYNQI